MFTQNKTNFNNFSIIILGALIAIGLALLGYIVGYDFLQAKKLDRVVSVKGMAERVIEADLVIWPITIKGVGNNLQEINNKIEQDRIKLNAYLLNQGIDQQEIELGQYNVFDTFTNSHDRKDDNSSRYVITAITELTSNKVTLIKKIYQAIPELVKDNILIELGEQYNYKGPNYEFTKFNDVKLNMLAEASKNAKKTAEQFAQDSSSKLGFIKRANQGTFIIEPLYNNEASSEGDARKSIKKKIRVVISIDYYLTD